MIRKAIFVLYRLAQTLALPAILIYLLFRGLRNHKYFPTLRERFGFLPASWHRTASGAIWLHAVSVGEVLAAVPLVERYPPLGRRAVLPQRFHAGRPRDGGEAAGNDCGRRGICAPFDFVWAVRRVLRRLQPSVVIVMETEIWPNLFREARRTGCGLALVNGRISDPLFSRAIAESTRGCSGTCFRCATGYSPSRTRCGSVLSRGRAAGAGRTAATLNTISRRALYRRIRR